MSKRLGYWLSLMGAMFIVIGSYLVQNRPSHYSQEKPMTLSEQQQSDIVASTPEVVTEAATAMAGEAVGEVTKEVSTERKKTPGYQKSNGVQKGEAFEEYVIKKFDLSRKSLSLISRAHLSGDSPDIVISVSYKSKNHRVALESVWRNSLPQNDLEWASDAKIKMLNSYSKKYNAQIFIIIGEGGTPSSPQKLYIVPFSERPYKNLYTSVIKKYQCQSLSGKFFYEVDSKNLTIK